MIDKGNFDNTLDYYILGDQPTTCGKCGSRTDFQVVADEVQTHQCLNIHCGYKFITVES